MEVREWGCVDGEAMFSMLCVLSKAAMLCVLPRSLMSSSPQLKARLQAAIQGNQESLNAKASAAANRTSKTSPSITLKTNFL